MCQASAKRGGAKSKKFELTEEQKQEIREAFDLFDTDGSGQWLSSLFLFFSILLLLVLVLNITSPRGELVGETRLMLPMLFVCKRGTAEPKNLPGKCGCHQSLSKARLFLFRR